jgi:hypothetical protein
MSPKADQEVVFEFLRPHTAVLEEQWGPNEIDFDDERDDDQLPLDQQEASDLGVLLDDPENTEL